MTRLTLTPASAESPALVVNGITVVDGEGYVPASRIKDDGEINLSERAAQLTNETVQNASDSIIDRYQEPIPQYRAPLDTAAPWAVNAFDSTIATLPNVNLPTQPLMDQWVLF